MLDVFISGLEKQTGKTLVAAGLSATMQSLAYTTSVYKPIQTNANVLNGFKSSPDLLTIKRFDANVNTLSTFMISGSASPFVSSYEDKINISIDTIFNEYRAMSNMTECNIVEGANSIASPIADNMTELDLVRGLRLPLLLVVNPSKTSIDNVIMGLNYVSSNKINLLGVIVNQYNENSENLEEKYFPQILKEYSGVKILGILPDYSDISKLAPETLIADILNKVSLEEIFRVKIAKLYN